MVKHLTEQMIENNQLNKHSAIELSGNNLEKPQLTKLLHYFTDCMRIHVPVILASDYFVSPSPLHMYQ